ncbi:succinyl-diaminopimelate desuccinylase [Candidatus Phycorickettsia trachydisci]|uniref:Succinyl-diaminopimelate desuccinylase n=1 Tax=Candidatus Phycorickettsia trachydisci TaxID=2115978 RepID=A0A2P1P8U6_9RICK|nr:succinyl-diaminopimelate desuccinylase [Candidatus Phycorickettsia trachydisci]AVP87692.1 succinyl-diaminopimelate desuccinylase [Candidatus Phycorickettsia trachydisci]
MSPYKIDLVGLAKKLIEFPSITPYSSGCIEYIDDLLKHYGFKTHILKFGPEYQQITNLYAYKNQGPNLCFGGHVDVVPCGDLERWKYPPFSGQVDGDRLYGRGAVDMKGGLAAMILAARDYLINNDTDQVSFLITSDEEGVAKYGTKAVMEWLEDKGMRMDFCILGEPTYQEYFGDSLQIGRRGSANFVLEVYGKQGHVAYDNFSNPHIPANKILDFLIDDILDTGNDMFPASKLNITSIDTSNIVTNIVPEKTSIRFNVRFNNLHSAHSLKLFLKNKILQITPHFKLELLEGESEPFITNIKNKYVELFQQSIKQITGRKAQPTTYGGTSDGRFIVDTCPVVEFGLASNAAHQVDEHLIISDLEKLYSVYYNFLLQFFDAQSK